MPGAGGRSVDELFAQVADAVGAVLVRTADWGPSGRRTGQYAVDVEADAACLDLLHGAGLAVLSEESGITGDRSAGALVVVDPLDGSTNAARGVPWCATALCLVVDGVPERALVANHGTGERFTAVRGEGARRDGTVVSVSGCTELAHAIVGLSGLPTHHYGWAQYRALGAAAPDLCAVAAGVLDGWCDTSTDAHGVWDYLAAQLVVEEAGGVVVDALGRDLVVLDPDARRTPVAAATTELIDQLLTERRR